MAKQKSQGEAVRQNNLSHIHTPNWQILVELELRAGGGMNGTIHESLMESLTPLHLHTEFLCKLSKFAQDAAARSMQVIKLMKLGHLHHIAFVPANVTSAGGDWGIFRIEKIENGMTDKSLPHHTIELYLYTEGQ
jgi:hypothetical protein